jgi:two-component system chemotaxis response regulator CheB
MLGDILTASGPLAAGSASDGQPIVPGRIYIAPPDYHLVLSSGYVHLGHGPKENLQRPCINVMFRSAAAAYSVRVVGVILTGMLDDGASGLWEIQRHGGATIVQDPQQAAYSSMPESAIHGFQVDYIVRLEEMGSLIARLARGEGSPVRQPDLRSHPEERATIGQSCPECGGAMTRVSLGGLHEYRCHIGHRLGLKTMIAEKGRLVERAISAAAAQLDEYTDLLSEMKQQADTSTVSALEKEIKERREQAERVRELLERALGSSVEAN